MVNQTVIVKGQGGLHLRPAGVFAKIAKSFECDVIIRTGTKSVNGKQVVSILSGNINCGDRIKIYCDGIDEEEALEALVNQMKIEN